MKKRKLLSKATIAELRERLEMGVPLATAIDKLNLDVSRPTVKRLVDLARHPEFDESLFPPWLNEDGPSVQEQPDDWNYVGYFPLGEWKQCNDL